MASTAQWVAGARPRTLPAAVTPVVVGSGAAGYAAAFTWWKALLALTVSVALQVAVNYANDYSDGIRGTDTDRVGPFRLVGSQAAAPAAVKRAAFAGFAVAAVAGLVVALTTAWWLVLVGAAAIAAAWYYTGGSHPYGYRGLGEVSVFVFFGLVAVIGTAYVQSGEVAVETVLAGAGVGSLACAILVANNLRDIPTDRRAGKRTLAVALAERGTRRLYVGLVVTAFLAMGAVVVAVEADWWLAVAALPSLALSLRAGRTVLTGASGLDLVQVLRDTGLAELLYGVALAFLLATA
jgi:1,4-dihydroxy-2-naphthoate polyprenyltransferase